MRRFTPIELALGASLIGCITAVAVPSFMREVHASRFVEPIDGLARLQTAALHYAEANGRFPDSAPLTPKTPPRGTKEVDPPGIWDAPTWRALDFRAAPDGVPHAYAFAFESTSSSFLARACGDLDGDGIYSSFEVRGTIGPDHEPAAQPGMYVEAELE